MAELFVSSRDLASTLTSSRQDRRFARRGGDHQLRKRRHGPREDAPFVRRGRRLRSVLRGRCSCNAVGFDVADEFVAAYNCHCSNCRAMTGSMFLPWGEIERDKIQLNSPDQAIQVVGDPDAGHALACARCLSLLLWTVGGGWARVPYGVLVDEPTRKPAAHMFVGSKAAWFEIHDQLPRFHERPPNWR